MSLVTEEIKSKAEVYYGDEMGKEKSQELLKEGSCGSSRKKSINHKFEKIGRLVCYGTEVTAYVEPKKIKKLTGVKTKELLVWLTLCDISLDDPPTGKMTFKTPSGLFRTFPASAFEVEETGIGAAAKEAMGVSGAVEVKEA
ncbi:T31J12.3 PROTEIN-RELATED [Salix koriyanagi]|uniref:T31J12.3 PROTEIN-RELATED n=1 Tax=Salix koriyanagi TaxID=2511006 RepID=A0A9Q0VYN0_9ROSI|nr:T31J12.3 PROTEIN-RELATED [Salix koriyanagi]